MDLDEPNAANTIRLDIENVDYIGDASYDYTTGKRTLGIAPAEGRPRGLPAGGRPCEGSRVPA